METDNLFRCPSCGNRQVRASQQRKMLDSLMHFLHMSPYRCRVCGLRFYEHEGALTESAAKQDSTGKSPAAH